MLSAFKPRANDWPPLSKRAGNFNAADWGPQEQQFKVVEVSRGAECARLDSDYNPVVLDESDSLVPRAHTQRTPARSYGVRLL